MVEKMFRQIGEDCSLLADDIISILRSRLEKETTEESTIASKKSLEPMTRLRKNVAELTAAENNDPDLQFIEDKFKDIFGG